MENLDIKKYDSIDVTLNLEYWNGIKTVGYCRIGNNHFPIIEAVSSFENVTEEQKSAISYVLKNKLSQFELNGQNLVIVEAGNL